MSKPTISRESMEAASKDLPLYQASNRLLAKGWSREEVNQYLQETPFEQIKADNLAHFNRKQGLS